MGLIDSYINGNFSYRSRHGEPKNRRQLFLCVLSEQLMSIPGINILYFIFWIPLVIWTVAMLITIMGYIESGEYDQITQTINSLVLGLIPTITITGPPRAGMAYLMRKWSVEEYAPAIPTFFKGIKDNFKQAIIISFISGMFPAVLWYGYNTIVHTNASGVLNIFFIITCIAAVIYFLMLEVIYGIMVTYDLPLYGVIRNSLILTLMHLFLGILIKLGSATFILIYMLFTVLYPNGIYAFLVIPILYYVSFGCGITELVYASYTNYLKDRHIKNES